MKFTDFYNSSKTRFSFEVFPPKDDAGIQNLFSALKELATYKPAFISVTYGAGGSTRDLTSDLALRIQKELGLTTAFHFTCVGSSREQIKDYVLKLKKDGINLIVALRGDPPKGGSGFVQAPDGFKYASELVRFLKDIDGLSLAVAGYPEGHIEATSKEDDLKHLKEKIDNGADIVITQLFFDNQDYFNFVEKARQIGIHSPIIPGIMPILNLNQVEKISALSGAKLPSSLHEQLVKCENDAEKMKQIGITHALSQCQELIKRGVPGIHFYILNKAYSTSKILGQL